MAGGGPRASPALRSSRTRRSRARIREPGGVLLDSVDLDATVARLRESGAEVDGPQDLPWGRRASFADPDGDSFILAAASPLR
ncbi:VOC family protein [Nocardia sp. NPDC051570]|uniref:VOC family protein n=1 Tax=Nocardia sp. NPDC051570 TaxID=3364324 RepID=UPI003799652D